MEKPNQCPQCKKYIFGEYCYTCKKIITKQSTLDILKDIFNIGDKE